jgi:cyclase
MLRTRVIPALLLNNESLVKTVRFKRFTYVGDPCNTVRIFNELEVDELVFLDITATRENRAPSLKVLAAIADECFMPLAYGGGIRRFEDAKAILRLGFEKIIVNSYALERPAFISELSEHFGSQAVIASIDVRRTLFGRNRVYARSGRLNTGRDPVAWAQECESLGAGEILLTSIDREGTWQGFDLDLISSVTRAVKIPLIAHGGAGSVAHIGQAVREASASAVALGSMVVFQRKGMGVLVNFPDSAVIARAIGLDATRCSPILARRIS